MFVWKSTYDNMVKAKDKTILSLTKEADEYCDWWNDEREKNRHLETKLEEAQKNDGRGPKGKYTGAKKSKATKLKVKKK